MELWNTQEKENQKKSQALHQIGQQGLHMYISAIKRLDRAQTKSEFTENTQELKSAIINMETVMAYIENLYKSVLG